MANDDDPTNGAPTASEVAAALHSFDAPMVLNAIETFGVQPRPGVLIGGLHAESLRELPRRRPPKI